MGKDAPPAAAPPAAEVDTRLKIAWDFNSALRLDYPPLASRDNLLIINPLGAYQGLSKSPRVLDPTELFHSNDDRPLSAAPGQLEDTAFLGRVDGHVYAIGVNSGKVLWRYTAGANVTRQPFAGQIVEGDRTERDLYITVDGKGLGRLNLDTGESLWGGAKKSEYNAEADRVLAVNPKFVYAADRSGRMLILARKNGEQLSRYDVQDFAFPVSNEDNDRIFLAANDGLIVCLHDKDYPKSLQYRVAAGKAVEKPLAERIAELKKKLDAKITEPGGDATTLKPYLADFAKRHGLKITINAKAFKELGLPPPDDKPVDPPKVEDVPLKDVLAQALDLADATFVQALDEILVTPKAKK
jgi:hypothetical protein